MSKTVLKFFNVLYVYMGIHITYVSFLVGKQGCR